MESMWSLALIVKSVVVAAVDADGELSCIPMLLHQQQFVESISYLAQLGTGLSRKWNVEDLEVIAFAVSVSLVDLTCDDCDSSLCVHLKI